MSDTNTSFESKEKEESLPNSIIYFTRPCNEGSDSYCGNYIEVDDNGVLIHEIDIPKRIPKEYSRQLALAQEQRTRVLKWLDGSLAASLCPILS